MNKKYYQYSLLASLLLHALFVLLSYKIPAWTPPTQNESIEVTLQEAPQIETLREDQLPKDNLQVVDQSEKAMNDEVPENAKYLSANNQVVKRETVAQQIGDFKNRKNEGQTPGTGGKPQVTLDQLKPQFDVAKMVKEKEIADQELEKSLEEDAIRRLEEHAQKQAQQSFEKGDGGADISQTSDYLKDKEKGMETLLSTREFVYYTFYARIRRQLNQHWGGKVRDKVTKMVREGRSIASAEDRITKLLITLDRRGKLIKVQVVGDSGVRDLDQAAVEAFQEAAPFPNPPEGIVESDGTIKIRWDFILEA